jgi:hypothetical protein
MSSTCMHEKKFQLKRDVVLCMMHVLDCLAAPELGSKPGEHNDVEDLPNAWLVLMIGMNCQYHCLFLYRHLRNLFSQLHPVKSL